MNVILSDSLFIRLRAALGTSVPDAAPAVEF